jgi:hypothetical protein
MASTRRPGFPRRKGRPSSRQARLFWKIGSASPTHVPATMLASGTYFNRLYYRQWPCRRLTRHPRVAFLNARSCSSEARRSLCSACLVPDERRGLRPARHEYPVPHDSSGQQGWTLARSGQFTCAGKGRMADGRLQAAIFSLWMGSNQEINVIDYKRFWRWSTIYSHVCSESSSVWSSASRRINYTGFQTLDSVAEENWVVIR